MSGSSVSVKIKVQLRKDTLQNWIASDPVLRDGEIAVVEDGEDTLLKIGNGVSSFTQIPYLFKNGLSSDFIKANAISQGFKSYAGQTNLATGIYTEASASFGVVHGIEARINQGDDYSFVFNGENLPGITQRYTSHGEGTFNVNALSGLSGIYVGEETLADILSRHYLKSETSSSIELEDSFREESDVISRKITVDGAQSDLSIFNVTPQEYSKALEVGIEDNALYFVSSDQFSAFGEKITDVAEPELSDDAATKNYVDCVSSEIKAQFPTKTSQLTNDSGYTTNVGTITGVTMNGVSKGTSGVVNLGTVLTAHQSLTAYETKSELTTDYYSKAQVNKISSDLSSSTPQIVIKDSQGVSSLNQLSIMNITPAEYSEILQSEAGAQRNALYIVSSDTTTAYGERITNVADAISASDAVNYGQMTSILSDLSITGDEDIDALRTMLSVIISRFGGNR